MYAVWIVLKKRIYAPRQNASSKLNQSSKKFSCHVAQNTYSKKRKKTTKDDASSDRMSRSEFLRTPLSTNCQSRMPFPRDSPVRKPTALTIMKTIVGGRMTSTSLPVEYKNSAVAPSADAAKNQNRRRRLRSHSVNEYFCATARTNHSLVTSRSILSFCSFVKKTSANLMPSATRPRIMRIVDIIAPASMRYANSA
jgi:hypothetical protein